MRPKIAGMSTFALLILAIALSASLAWSQTNGVPSSVTSLGPGRVAVETGGPGPQTMRVPGGTVVPRGVPPSVTSLGPGGTVVDNGFNNDHGFRRESRFGQSRFRDRRHQAGDAGAVLLYDPWVSYAGMYPPPQSQPTIIIVQTGEGGGEMHVEPDGMGGYRVAPRPREEQRYNEYGEPLGKPEITLMGDDGEPLPKGARPQRMGREGAPHAGRPMGDGEMEEKPAPPPDPNSGQATTLVFRDGHREQVHSYIIMSDALIDLGSQSHRRIPLDQLNLDETRKINGDIGIDFVVPERPANARPSKTS